MLWQGLLVATAFSGILTVMQLALPLYSMQIFDRVIPTSSLPTLAALSLLMGALLFCMGLLDGSRAIILGRLASRIDLALHGRALSVAVESPTGTLFLRDIETSRVFISSPIAAALLDLPWSVAFVIAMFLLHPILGWLTIASGLLVLLLGLLAHFVTRHDRYLASRLSQTTMGVIETARRDRHASTAMGLQSASFRRTLELCLERITTIGKAYERQSWIDAACRGLRNMMQVVILACAAVLTMSHEVGVGTIVASSMLFARAIAPLERVGAGYQVIAGFASAWRRLSSLSAKAGSGAKLAIHPISGQISVERLTFGSPGRQNPVLRQVTFSLEAGKLLAVVGREGAGKSTLAKLLVGAMRPSMGDVRLDGSNLADFDRVELGRQIGFLPENVQLPDCSVAEVISRYERMNSDEVVRAAKLAGAHAMIQRLPDGYQTRIGTDPYLQSAGERQRLALARTFYRAPKLIVLDEPTAFLDDSGERDLIAAVHELKSKGSTIIVISRFPGFLHSADYLMMLDGGEVKLFADQYNMQDFLTPRLAASQDRADARAR